ncbi:MAG TPA: PLP-dependent aminotransferase family protein [Anaerolineales bacterium]|nr:PLP-dependent aminotransferase family protein [Anaerolineales bacterium]
MRKVPAKNARSTFLYENLAKMIRQSISAGIFQPGDRIPSVRQMSRQNGVSITTVLQAYQGLEEQGLIESRPQSGYYVAKQVEIDLPEPDISSPSKDPSLVSLHDLIMMILRDTQNSKLVQLGAAIPNLELMPIDQLNKIFLSLIKQGEQGIYQYCLPPGLESLRLQIAKRAVQNGCQLSPNEIIITSGCTESIDLCLYATCKQGDIVAIEAPMFFGTLQSLETHKLRALEIPTDPRTGIGLDALQFAIEHNPIKAVLISSNFNNPLGGKIPTEKKKELVALLEKHEIPLIDNDISGEIYFTDSRPSITKSFDKKGLVLLCSSFSKDISPAFRVGWVAPGRFYQEIEWLKFTSSVATSSLPQMVIARFLESGKYDHHLRRIRRAYAANVAMMSQAVINYFPDETRVTRPSGGFVQWVQLPESIDSLELYKDALKAGITITPGTIYSPTNQFNHFIRLNAADWSYRIERALEELGHLAKRRIS